MEDLKQKLLENAGSLLEWTNSAGEFVAEQAPLYVQELIEWKFWEASIYAVFSFLCLTAILWISVWMIIKFLKFIKEDSDAAPFGLLFIFLFIPITIFSAEFISNLTDAVKCKVAPRVIIVEELQKMVK